MSYKLLSYPISENSPAWPGACRPELSQQVFVSKGDACNEWDYKLRNHVGTHMDGPNHHLEDGLKIADLPLDRFIYEKPFILDIPKGKSEMILKEDLEKYEKEISEADLLMLRTGQSRIRKENPEAYGKEGAAVSSGAAEYLVKNFPNLKSVILDFISLCTYVDMKRTDGLVPDGDIAHRWMLGKWTENFICIIEDADLSGIDNEHLEQVIALPLFIKKIDSAQVTVLAKLRD